eukprot:1160145-Pelagomonas_calceolata.AAC.1
MKVAAQQQRQLDPEPSFAGGRNLCPLGWVITAELQAKLPGCEGSAIGRSTGCETQQFSNFAWGHVFALRRGVHEQHAPSAREPLAQMHNARGGVASDQPGASHTDPPESVPQSPLERLASGCQAPLTGSEDHQAVLEDDGHLILGLLQPYHPGMRCRVTTMLQDVQELTLKLLGDLMPERSIIANEKLEWRSPSVETDTDVQPLPLRRVSIRGAKRIICKSLAWRQNKSRFGIKKRFRVELWALLGDLRAREWSGSIQILSFFVEHDFPEKLMVGQLSQAMCENEGVDVPLQTEYA